MKKGIVELSDLILVNKSDGTSFTPFILQLNSPRCPLNPRKFCKGMNPPLYHPNPKKMEYTSALKFVQLRTTWRPRVLCMSSHEKTGIDQVWSTMKEFFDCVHVTIRARFISS